MLTAAPEPSGLPLVLMLWTREHEDAGEIDDDLASEFGRISNRLVRIIEGLPGIGRVHVNRWGDGSAHFHVWFFARPDGFAQIKGSYAVEWDDILPPVDDGRSAGPTCTPSRPSSPTGAGTPAPEAYADHPPGTVDG